MKLQLMLAMAGLVAAAGPAAAETAIWGAGHGTPRLEREHFAPLPPLPYATSQAPASRRNYGTPPEAQPFKPYQPQSVYSHPKGYGGAQGAKDCELSVYVNACGRRR